MAGPGNRRKAFASLSRPERNFVADALRAETVGGILLLLAAVAALIWANTPLKAGYESAVHAHAGPSVLGLHLSIQHWTADGLLAVFFFVAGIELLRSDGRAIHDPEGAVPARRHRLQLYHRRTDLGGHGGPYPVRACRGQRWQWHCHCRNRW